MKMLTMATLKDGFKVMITRKIDVKDINAILLNVNKRIEKAYSLQGSLYYNYSLMTIRYNNIAQLLKNKYSSIITKKRQIEALQHLIYGHIWDMYYSALSAINKYDQAVERLAELRAQKETIDDDIATARANKESYYNDYTAAQTRYNEIETDYNARIAQKEIEIGTTQINLNNKRAALENAEAVDACFTGDVADLVFDRIALASKDYTVHSWTTERQCTFEDDSWDFVANQQGHSTWVEIPGLGPFISKTANFDWKMTLTEDGYCIYARIVTGSGLGGTITLAAGGIGYTYSTEAAASTALQNLWTNTINTIKDYWNTQRPDVATLEAEVAALENQLATQQAELSQLQTDKTNALNAQQAVIDAAYDNYVYWRDRQAQLESLKRSINTYIENTEELVDTYHDEAETKSRAYNDAVNDLETETERAEYPHLPDPWDDIHTEPEEDDDEQNDAGNDDDE